MLRPRLDHTTTTITCNQSTSIPPSSSVSAKDKKPILVQKSPLQPKQSSVEAKATPSNTKSVAKKYAKCHLKGETRQKSAGSSESLPCLPKRTNSVEFKACKSQRASQSANRISLDREHQDNLKSPDNEVSFDTKDEDGNELEIPENLIKCDHSASLEAIDSRDGRKISKKQSKSENMLKAGNFLLRPP